MNEPLSKEVKQLKIKKTNCELIFNLFEHFSDEKAACKFSQSDILNINVFLNPFYL